MTANPASVFKCSLLLLLMFALSIGVKAQPSYSKLDEKNGFRDLTFGTPIESISGLVLSRQVFTTDNLVQNYTRPTDVLEIGGFPVYSIQYSFYKNRLYSITISVVNSSFNDNGESIKRVLIREYGEGQVPYGRSMAWLGKEVWMSFGGMSEFSIVNIKSKPLSDQHDAEENANYKPKSSGL